MQRVHGGGRRHWRRGRNRRTTYGPRLGYPGILGGFILRRGEVEWTVARSGYDGFDEESFAAIAGSASNDVWTLGTRYVDPSEEPDFYGFADYWDGTRTERKLNPGIGLFAVASRGPGGRLDPL